MIKQEMSSVVFVKSFGTQEELGRALVAVEREQVSLRVEDPPAQVDLVFVSKEQVEVFERLPEEEGLHHVSGPGVQSASHVADGGVAAAHLRVLFNALHIVGYN